MVLLPAALLALPARNPPLENPPAPAAAQEGGALRMRNPPGARAGSLSAPRESAGVAGGDFSAGTLDVG